MKPMTLRLLPVGFSFYLLRTGQRFTLVSVGPSPFGGRRYTVQREGAKHPTWLHHSCHIKPVLGLRDYFRLNRLDRRTLPLPCLCDECDLPSQSNHH
jgi:hypothetical protein